MSLIIILGLIALVIYVIYMSFKSYKLPKNNLMAFTGTLGSGKTYIAVNRAIRAYRRQRLKHAIYKRCKIFKYFCRESVYPASLYSNIPIQVNLSKKNRIKSIPFTKEHLLMRKILPERCVVLIDEIGQFCSQWEYDNPYVMENVQTLVRFFRHFTNGYCFMTDQVSDNIVKPIRDRIGYIYQLNGFERVFGILPFYKVDIVPILCLDNGMTSIEQEEPTLNFVFGFLPYRWMNWKHYESRCFRKLYTSNAVKENKEFADDLYTNYVIDLSVSTTVKKDYKKNKDDYKTYLYDRFDEHGNLKEFRTVPLADDVLSTIEIP